MAIFDWCADYETGIDIIDSQHKHLVDLINQLDTALSKNSNLSDKQPIDIEDIYAQLFDYTVYHFATEEKLMEESDYRSTAFEAHRKQHDQFILELKSVLSDFHGSTIEDGQVILSFLTNWLINHICKIDKKLAQHILENEKQTPSLPGVSLIPERLRDNQFIEIFLDFSDHLYRNIRLAEQQINELKKRPEPDDGNTSTTTQLFNRIQQLKTIIKNLESSARGLRKKEED